MMHGFKVSMAKGTTKKEIMSSDDSHTVTQNILAQWKSSLKSLHDALLTNEASWAAVFASYGSFQTITDSVYSDRDVEIRGVMKVLQTGRAAVETPPKPVEPSYNAPQKVEIARQELQTMLSRIANCEALHAKRFEATRHWMYYDRKTKQMLDAESRRKSAVSPKDIERRSRNQQKVMDLATQLNSCTAQLYSELEYIDVERLAITDRAIAAMLQLQKFYYEAQPTKDAYANAEQIRLGRRVIPRDEVPPWMPSTLHPVDPNPAVSNPNMPQAPMPQPSMAPQQSMLQQPMLQQSMSQQPMPQQPMPQQPVYPQSMPQQPMPQVLVQMPQQPQQMHPQQMPPPQMHPQQTYPQQMPPQQPQQMWYPPGAFAPNGAPQPYSQAAAIQHVPSAPSSASPAGAAHYSPPQFNLPPAAQPAPPQTSMPQTPPSATAHAPAPPQQPGQGYPPPGAVGNTR